MIEIWAAEVNFFFNREVAWKTESMVTPVFVTLIPKTLLACLNLSGV